jgi:hypothetical protein
MPYPWKSPRVSCICEICGKSFLVTEAYRSHGWGKYCSNRCKGDAYSVRIGTLNPFYGKKHDSITLAKITEASRHPHSSATKERQSKGVSLFYAVNGRSSDHCKKLSEGGKGKHAGSLNPRFNNWSSRVPYGEEWSPELRDRIMIRDDYECQSCGATHRHHVHHINSVKVHNEEWNLITLCIHCHLTATPVQFQLQSQFYEYLAVKYPRIEECAA